MFENLENENSGSQLYGRGTGEFVIKAKKEYIATEPICKQVSQDLLRQDLFFEDISPGWFVRDFLMCRNMFTRKKSVKQRELTNIGYRTKFTISYKEAEDLDGKEEQEKEFHIPKQMFAYLNFRKFLSSKN